MLRRVQSESIPVSTDIKAQSQSPVEFDSSDGGQPIPDPDGDGAVITGPIFSPVEVVTCEGTEIKSFTEATFT
jgi:hypothetical protein